MSKIDFGVLNQESGIADEQKTPKASGYETREVAQATGRTKRETEERRDKQISIKGPQHVIEKFQAICERDRWAYWQMLEMMTNAWEQRGSDR